MTSEDDKDFVQSLAKGIDVIRSFSPEEPKLSVSQVAGKTGLTRASARRFLITWNVLGYLDIDGSRYSLTPKLLELGYSYLSSIPWRESVMAQLRNIAEQTGESCSVETLLDDHVIHVARVAGKDVLAPNIPVGTKFPALATASGRVLLSYLSEETIDQFIRNAKPKRLTDNTIVDPSALKRVILQSKCQGYCIVLNELKENLWVLAVPIVDNNSTVVAAINIGGYGSIDVQKILGFLPLLTKASSALRNSNIAA